MNNNQINKLNQKTSAQKNIAQKIDQKQSQINRK